MSTELSSLIPYLNGELGHSTADTLSTGQKLQALNNSFWDSRLQGVTALTAYTEAEGVVITNAVGGDEISRDLLQVIVLFAAVNIILGQLRNLQTTFRTAAGPVQYETGQSATLLRDVLKATIEKRNIVLKRLSDIGQTDIAMIDLYTASTDSLAWGLSSFVSGVGDGGW
jgi:hypothetical protein